MTTEHTTPAHDARKIASEVSNAAAEKASEMTRDSGGKTEIHTRTEVPEGQGTQYEAHGGLLSTATHYALDTARTVANSTAELAGSITQKGINVVHFATDTAASAAKLGTGVVVEGAEFGVGLGATVLDVAGTVTHKAVETIGHIQHRGHEVTEEVKSGLSERIHATEDRGGRVLNQATAPFRRVGGEMVASGIETAQNVVEQAAGMAQRAGQTALDTGSGIVREATQTMANTVETGRQIAMGAKDTAMGTASSAANMAGNVVKSGEGVIQGAAETVKEKGMEAMEGAHGVVEKGVELTSKAARSAKDTAESVAYGGAEMVREGAESAKQTAKSVARGGAETMREGAESAKQTAKGMAQQGGETARQTAGTAKEAAGRTTESAQGKAGGPGIFQSSTAGGPGLVQSGKEAVGSAIETGKEIVGSVLPKGSRPYGGEQQSYPTAASGKPYAQTGVMAGEKQRAGPEEFEVTTKVRQRDSAIGFNEQQGYPQEAIQGLKGVVTDISGHFKEGLKAEEKAQDTLAV